MRKWLGMGADTEALALRYRFALSLICGGWFGSGSETYVG